ncbi:hypothetical protein H9Q69_000282 [Fusarium xylarioides]|uniref:FAD-binding domain-containing protein n=1 Tax=Fusarium xylarioides TaxID=221167 RepID=A0A9P7LB89_9HYPO|nr:hypothetical protein H9Q70_001609 [Fusarium xylarioides]KAG5774129.1 hypothetical protein H9Q72_000418 [Fusarium xylarioides]KAG5782813.1 hypothetical protein H9Q73_003543 [Fusarium xylarioides]KAG5800723.1 hypothetical protein H9Q69_000282 [Fusarium xylarioides]KAG5818520.1 hypothetical protein H9Q74_010022 [Fusarium xylarioides]
MAKPSRNELHVAIVGASIGGLALAMALHKNGISFTLYEDAKEYSAVGAGIGFAPNGMRTMDLIEPGFRPLYEAICVGNKGEHAQVSFSRVCYLKRVLPWYGHSGWGHPDYIRKSVSAHRKTLLDIMTSFIPIENVKFNKRLTNIEERPDGVTLSFQDKTTAECSVLAGADGIKSTVRAHVLENYPSQIMPVYAGAYCYHAVIPMSKAYKILSNLTNITKFCFRPKLSAITYRISGSKKLKGAVTETIPHEARMADFKGPGVDNRFRQLLAKAKPIKWGFFHHFHTASYYRGQVALVGDSAHTSLPFQAAGTAQGLDDALVLSNVLAKIVKLPQHGAELAPFIQAGLSAYDSIRHPHAQKQLEQTAKVGRMIFFQHEEAGDNMDKILPRLQQGMFNWLLFHDMNDDAQEAVKRMQKHISIGRPSVARI